MNEKCGKRQSKKAAVGSLLNMTKEDMIKLVSMKYGIKNAHKMSRQDLCQLLVSLRHASPPKIVIEQKSKTPPIVKFKVKTPLKHKKYQLSRFLTYNNNSCYIDSTLTAIFNTNRIWLNEAFAMISIESDQKLHKVASDIRDELGSLYRHMIGEVDISGKVVCTKLRKLLQSFEIHHARVFKYKPELRDWIGTKQEPTDLMNILTNVFKVPEIKVQVNDHMRNMAFNAPSVPVSDMKRNQGKNRVSFEDYFPVYTDVTKISYLSANVICFNIERNFFEEKILTEFDFPEEVKMLDGSALKLCSVIIHHGSNTKYGHYTCMIKSESSWMHYDDMHPSLHPIGTFNQLCKWNNKFVMKNCTNLFYCKII